MLGESRSEPLLTDANRNVGEVEVTGFRGAQPMRARQMRICERDRRTAWVSCFGIFSCSTVSRFAPRAATCEAVVFEQITSGAEAPFLVEFLCGG